MISATTGRTAYLSAIAGYALIQDEEGIQRISVDDEGIVRIKHNELHHLLGLYPDVHVLAVDEPPFRATRALLHMLHENDRTTRLALSTLDGSLSAQLRRRCALRLEERIAASPRLDSFLRARLLSLDGISQNAAEASKLASHERAWRVAGILLELQDKGRLAGLLNIHLREVIAPLSSERREEFLCLVHSRDLVGRLCLALGAHGRATPIQLWTGGDLDDVPPPVVALIQKWASAAALMKSRSHEPTWLLELSQSTISAGCPNLSETTGHLSALSSEISLHATVLRRKPRGRCSAALTWIALEHRAICPALLLSIRDILKRAPSPFLEAYGDLYSEAYGRLLASLIERLPDDPAHGPTAAHLWAEMSDSFKEANSWRERATALRTANVTITALADPGGRAEFWALLDLYSTYVSAAYCNPAGLEDDLLLAGRLYMDIVHLLLHRLSEHGPHLSDEGGHSDSALLLARAMRLGLRVALRTSHDIRKWAADISVYRKTVGPQSSAVEQELSLTAQELVLAASRAADPANRVSFAEALSIAVPLLQNRRPSGPRVKLPPDDAACILELPDGQISARIQNVTLTKNRGFAIETSELTLASRVLAECVTPTGKMIDDFVVRAIRVLREGRDERKPITLSQARLRLQFADHRTAIIRCDILRAWPLPLPKHGIGIVLMASAQEAESPLDRQDYISSLPHTRRYDPYDLDNLYDPFGPGILDG